MRKILHNLLETGPYPGRMAVAYRLAISAAAVLGTGSRVLFTIPDFEAALGPLGHWIECIAVIILTADLIAHALNAALNRHPDRSTVSALVDYIKSPGGIIDILAALPYWVAQIWTVPFDLRTADGLLRFLKLARYSPALAYARSR